METAGRTGVNPRNILMDLRLSEYRGLDRITRPSEILDIIVLHLKSSQRGLYPSQKFNKLSFFVKSIADSPTLFFFLIRSSSKFENKHITGFQPL